MHVLYDDLKLYLLGDLSETQVAAIDAHLIDCNVCRDGVVAALRQLSRSVDISKPDGNRREPRIAVGDAGSMQLLNPLSTDRSPVRIVNFSRAGVCLDTTKPLALGSEIKVGIRGVIAFGKVRYCVPVADGFQVGVKLCELR